MDNNEDRALVGDQPTGGDTPERNVDKIREILFGGQMRDYQRRFDQLEQRLAAASEELRADVAGRIEKLESFVHTELEVISERLGAERRERTADQEQRAAELHEARRQIDERLAQVDDKSAAEARALRSALQQQGAELGELVRRVRDEITESLNRQAAQLEDNKVAREDLAALFSEVALRLNREFDLPGED